MGEISQSCRELMASKIGTGLFAGLIVVASMGAGTCAPTLTPGGKRVQPVSKEFVLGCRHLGVVVGISPKRPLRKRPGWSNSINAARNKVDALGGDAMIIIVRDRFVEQGRGFVYTTQAVALQCGLEE